MGGRGMAQRRGPNTLGGNDNQRRARVRVTTYVCHGHNDGSLKKEREKGNS